MTALSRDKLEEMVARFLSDGEHRSVVAAVYGVDASLPPLRAYTWGFIDARISVVSESDLTPAGRAWLAARKQGIAA